MGGFVDRPGIEREPSSYKCLRCQYSAVVFVKGIPYCDNDRPDKVVEQTKSKLTVVPTTTGGSSMTEAASKKPESTSTVVTAPAETEPKNGNWIVRAKDGTELRSGFLTKKEASRWAMDEVNAQKLKAGQYKIVSKVA